MQLQPLGFPHRGTGLKRRRPGRQVALEGSELGGRHSRLRMQHKKLRQRHCAQLNHIHRFVQRGFLRRRRLRPQGREIEVFACGENIVPDQPVSRHDVVKPGESGLIGMAAIAVLRAPA